MKLFRIQSKVGAMEFVDWYRADDEAQARAAWERDRVEFGLPDETTITVREATAWESKAIGTL